MAIQEEAQKQLEEAEPALIRATQALDSIKPADIIEITGYQSPLSLVRIIVGVLILRFKKLNSCTPENYDYKEQQYPSIEPSWQYGQAIMKSGDFLKSLKFYNLEFINEEICNLLVPYLNMLDFTPEAAPVTSAAEGLCSWVSNMVQYHQVEKVVRPKKLATAATMARLEKA